VKTPTHAGWRFRFCPHSLFAPAHFRSLGKLATRRETRCYPSCSVGTSARIGKGTAPQTQSLVVPPCAVLNYQESWGVRRGHPQNPCQTRLSCCVCNEARSRPTSLMSLIVEPFARTKCCSTSTPESHLIDDSDQVGNSHQWQSWRTSALRGESESREARWSPLKHRRVLGFEGSVDQSATRYCFWLELLHSSFLDSPH